VRETETGNATPPCLLRGDITGRDAEGVQTVKLLGDS